MWKLFTKSWASLFSHRHVSAAENLESEWRVLLDEALRRATPRALEVHGFDAPATLRALRGHELLKVYGVLRSESFRRQPLAASARTPRAAQASDDEKLADVFLFVASCNPNGFVRERAVTEFARHPCALAFAAGLIRANDWVPQVMSAASSLVNSVVHQLSPDDVVRYLDLATRLNDDRRLSHGLWQTTLEPKLRAPESRDALWMAARDLKNSSGMRRSAFDLLVPCDAAEIANVVECAIADPDSRMGLWALDQVEALDSADQRARLLKAAFRADHSSVRCDALRMYVRLKPADLAATLRAALFDRSRGVRSVAAFQLEHAVGEGALPIWRVAANHSGSQEADVAVFALCENGERQDLEHFAARFSEWPAAIRAAILRGLWRVESPMLEPSLEAALHDRSKVVMRQLTRIYCRAMVAVNVTALDAALARAELRMVPNLLAVSSALGKWEELEFLLRHAVADEDRRAGCAADYVDRWIRTEHRRFTVPSTSQMQQVAELSRTAQERHSVRRWGTIQRALAAFA
jgi:hypothetical protein